MRVKGIGIDIFEKKRMKAALSRKTSVKILQKIFSASEIAAFKRSPGKEIFFLGTGDPSPRFFESGRQEISPELREPVLTGPVTGARRFRRG